jgi:hypothetical protein
MQPLSLVQVAGQVADDPEQTNGEQDGLPAPPMMVQVPLADAPSLSAHTSH